MLINELFIILTVEAFNSGENKDSLFNKINESQNILATNFYNTYYNEKITSSNVINFIDELKQLIKPYREESDSEDFGKTLEFIDTIFNKFNESSRTSEITIIEIYPIDYTTGKRNSRATFPQE